MKKNIYLASVLSLAFAFFSCASAPKAGQTDYHDLAVKSLHEKDFCTAASLFEKACNDGNMESCTALGDSYANGDCKKQDICKANSFYEKACNGGNMMGCSYLADSYENGLCLAKDLDKATELYKLACEKGEINCKKFR